MGFFFGFFLVLFLTIRESNLPESSRMYFLLGLNLVNLLSQNRISEFHTLLERIDPIAMQQNQYVKHAIKIEQCLMEGSFNKVRLLFIICFPTHSLFLLKDLEM